ncbi:hypothetical protein DPMN_142532 [Dreissena polymorpha]|uniref:Reelin domain-containing protein n=1 Tax=Dreissena polymorpha TaxID=45954 RepID=A0A9D4JKV4_DREPO|nr:hypothetical protein DPMN_142532 [Dreissena polymorpha]
MQRLLISLALVLVCCHGYALGPPIEACVEMFPLDHGADARKDSSPFTMTINATSYSPGDVIKVVLNTSEIYGHYFLEGLFVQMRPVTCVNTSVGTFSIETGDDFLKTMDCFAKPASAIAHYSHEHIHDRTFYWTAPSTANGHLYLRATVARNLKNFWTNVFSDFILDASIPNASPTTLKTCAVRSKQTSGVSITTSSSVVIFAALVVLAFVTKLTN